MTPHQRYNSGLTVTPRLAAGNWCSDTLVSHKMPPRTMMTLTTVMMMMILRLPMDG